MPADPLRLAAIALTALRATPSPTNVGAWAKAMERTITQAHTAAWLVGTAERVKVPVDSPLLSQRRLSRAERADVRRAVDAQLKYLQGFVADVRAGRLSEAQIAARAELYAGATRGTYYAARWGEWELPWVPGDGSSECLGRCRCSASVVDSGAGSGVYTWVLGGEQHCTTCPARAGDHPVKRRAA